MRALPASAKSDWRPLVRAGKLFTVGIPSVEQHVAFLQYAAQNELTGPALRYTLVHNLQDLVTATTTPHAPPPPPAAAAESEGGGNGGDADTTSTAAAAATSTTAAISSSPWLAALGELLSAADAGADVAISHAYARLILETQPDTPVTVQLLVENKRAVAALATLLFTEASSAGDADVAHSTATKHAKSLKVPCKLQRKILRLQRFKQGSVGIRSESLLR